MFPSKSNSTEDLPIYAIRFCIMMDITLQILVSACGYFYLL